MLDPFTSFYQLISNVSIQKAERNFLRMYEKNIRLVFLG